MSHSAPTPSRQRRGGRNRSRSPEHGSRDQHQRQRYQRDTETFQRPKGGPKLSAWQKFLSFIGLGPKPPLRRADRPALGAAESESTRPSRPPSAFEGRPPRGDASGDSRPPREPRAPRPVIQHEVTSGRLYVGNLSYDVTESDLTELFGGLGQVTAVEVVVNKNTQRSKGFAFVEMLSVDQAKRAVAELHDKEYMGRKMLVTGAKAPDAPRPAGAEPRAGEFRDGEGRSQESRPAAPRSSEPRAFEPRSSEPRSSEPRSSEPRSSESRPPRRESRPPAGGPSVGDVTTGIIRREQLQGGVVPPAGPVILPPAPTPTPAAEVPASDSATPPPQA